MLTMFSKKTEDKNSSKDGKSVPKNNAPLQSAFDNHKKTKEEEFVETILNLSKNPVTRETIRKRPKL